MRVSVLGLGYVGCVTAACLAKAGHKVLGVDINQEKVAIVNAAEAPIVEPGLDELLAEVVRKGWFRATTSMEEAVIGSDMSLICVGTPSRANGQIEVSAVERVGREIGRVLRRHPQPHTVILRSTVLPGTTEQVLVPALWSEAGEQIGSELRVAVNPEFMREGILSARFCSAPAHPCRMR